MARMSRLLSAVSLGIAMTAAVGAAVVAVEHTRVHKTPTKLQEAAGSGRVIVQFRERSSIMSATASKAVSTGGPQKAAVLGSRLGLALTDGRVLGDRMQVVKSSGLTSSALAAAVATDADVEWVEIDHRRFIQVAPVNDPRYPDNLSTSVASLGPASGQWYLRAPGFDHTGRNLAAGINVEPAWAITHGSGAIVVGDVDTGITSHPELSSKMLTGYDFIADVPTANDGNGRDSDPSDPGDFITAAENSNKNGSFYGCADNGTGAAVAEDSSWHGTQTASILGAATNNGTGMAGTGYDTQVIPARALGKCGGYDSDIIAAAQWSAGIAVSGVPANAHPARVINMSLGAQGPCSQAYITALTTLRNKGVVVVVAAGNDEGLAVGTPANCKPAATDADQTPIVIAVAGLRHAGDKVGYSDIGREVTISAPAGNCVNDPISAQNQCLYPILTATNSGTTTPVTAGGTYSDGVNYSAGTSFATPMVAGTVALMLSAAPNLTNAQVIDLIKQSARTFPSVSDTSPQPPVCTVPVAEVKDSNGNVITPGSAPQDECICTTSTCGAGMLDAGAAVTAAAALSTGTPPTAAVASPTASVTVGSTVTLDGSSSALGVGSGVGTLSYSWTVLDGASNISLGAANASTVVVTGLAAGTARALLTVSDARGISATAVTTVTVTASSSSGGGGGGGSSGGGGAANPAWLAALLLAGLLLRPRARARTRA
jgi:serine protease